MPTSRRTTLNFGRYCLIRLCSRSNASASGSIGITRGFGSLAVVPVLVLHDGRQLVTALLAGVDGDRSITVNAAPASIPFWERVGFNPDPRDGHTHVLSRESV